LSPQTALGQSSLFQSRILLVEDNSTNRLLLRDYLSHMGYHVSALVNGSEFFSALAQFRPHIILLDLKLPDIDGFDLLQQLCQSQDWCHVPVIVVSAYAFNTDQQRALALGARHYLVKPVDLNTLNQKIIEELRYVTP
jgi:two-component system, cell cycle response regulator DivK